MDKYLICKAHGQFGTRLHVLSEALLLAKKYNRILLVDWQAENEPINFYQYFSLVDLPYISEYSHLAKDLNVYPDFWFGQEQKKLGLWAKNFSALIDCDFCSHTISEEIWLYAPLNLEGKFSLVPLLQHLRINHEVLRRLQSVLTQFDLLIKEINSENKKQIQLVVLNESDIEVTKRNLAYQQLSSSINSPTIILAENSQQINLLSSNSCYHRVLSTFDLNLIEWQILLLILLGRCSSYLALAPENMTFQIAQTIGESGINRLSQSVKPARQLNTCYPNHYQYWRDESKPFIYDWNGLVVN